MAVKTPTAKQCTLDSQQFRRVEELLVSWKTRTKKQVEEISRIAENVTALDLELCETVGRLEKLQAQKVQAENHQREIDAALEQIERHQRSLLESLESVEASLVAEVEGSKPPNGHLQHPLPAAVRALQTALEDSESRVTELTHEVNSIQKLLFPGSTGEFVQQLNENQRALARLEEDSQLVKEKVAARR